MQVGAANADEVVFDDDLTRCGGGWGRNILNPKIFGRVEP
jgi:hypothetical protein